MNSSANSKYWQALERLKAAGKRINNDTVAIEAGSKKGSIKKSRRSHAQLVEAIAEASAIAKDAKLHADPVPELQNNLRSLKKQLDDALEREINLLDELVTVRYERDLLQKEVSSLRSGNLQLFQKKIIGKQR